MLDEMLGGYPRLLDEMLRGYPRLLTKCWGLHVCKWSSLCFLNKLNKSSLCPLFCIRYWGDTTNCRSRCGGVPRLCRRTRRLGVVLGSTEGEGEVMYVGNVCTCCVTTRVGGTRSRPKETNTFRLVGSEFGVVVAGWLVRRAAARPTSKFVKNAPVPCLQTSTRSAPWCYGPTVSCL